MVLGLISVSAEAQTLVDKWRARMPELNESYQSIRKLQSTYELLYKVHEDETILQKEHDALRVRPDQSEAIRSMTTRFIFPVETNVSDFQPQQCMRSDSW